MTDYEKPSDGNKHHFTINQHVIPKKHIEQFYNDKGLVEVFNIKQKKFFSAKANNPCFCVKRKWDQRTESCLMKKIEDAFQEEIVKNKSFDERGHKVISQYFFLLVARKNLGNEGDTKLFGVSERNLSIEEQENLERKGYIYLLEGGVIKERFTNSLNILRDIDCLTIKNENLKWGLITTETGEFIMPDNLGSWFMFPISPKKCFVGGCFDANINSYRKIADINNSFVKESKEFFFGKDMVLFFKNATN